jgi:hypothetical protein
MDFEKMGEAILALTTKAAECNDSGDAMKFAQAASSLSHALRALVDVVESIPINK